MRLKLINSKQGRSSSIGVNIISFVLRQLTHDFKEENTGKNLSNIENQFHILLNNNLLFNYLLFKGSISGKPNKIFLEAWPIREGGSFRGVH